MAPVLIAMAKHPYIPSVYIEIWGIGGALPNSPVLKHSKDRKLLIVVVILLKRMQQ